MRTTYDCRMLAAGICEFTTAEAFLVLGMLSFEYQQRPDALFWDILQKVSEKRIGMKLIGVKG